MKAFDNLNIIFEHFEKRPGMFLPNLKIDTFHSFLQGFKLGQWSMTQGASHIDDELSDFSNFICAKFDNPRKREILFISCL